MRRIVVSLLLVSCCLLAACGREPLYHSQSYVFGTLVDISIYGEDPDRAREIAGEIQQDFQRWHNQFHAWQPDSEVSALNAAFAKGEAVAVSPELATIIADATAWYEKSNGLFNPAIGALVNAWGFQADEFKPIVVDDGKIALLVDARPQMTDIQLSNGKASSKNPAVRLDFGGYAKGYALDRAVQHLHAEGVKNALVNIGGNIIAIGRHGDKPWRVGIQHPRKPAAIATLDLEDGWAIGTSGDYQRYFEHDGARYCHIIDPRTGYPAQDMQAVTLLMPPGKQSGVISDVASKPIFIAASDDKQSVIDALGIEHVMLINGKGQISISKQMARRIQWIGNVSPTVF
jgi:FAD:protein FMN transferase